MCLKLSGPEYSCFRECIHLSLSKGCWALCVQGFRGSGVSGFRGRASWTLHPYPQKTHNLRLFWVQRPYYVRLLGYFDAKGKPVKASSRTSSRTELSCRSSIHSKFGIGVKFRVKGSGLGFRSRGQALGFVFKNCLGPRT